MKTYSNILKVGMTPMMLAWGESNAQAFVK